MIRKHKFTSIRNRPVCTVCGHGKSHKIHQLKKPAAPRRQARHPAASTPEPLHHASEESLEQELRSLVDNASTYLATRDYPGLLSVSHSATIEEAGTLTTPQDHGLYVTMNDGSVFKLLIVRERGPEIDFPDQSE